MKSALTRFVALCEAYGLVIVKDAATGVVSIKPGT
jgi:dTDP-4-amino-4,6-dideoxygalactose transaminase